MLLLSLTTLMGCGLFGDEPAQEAVKPKARPSLVLVTLDTTRADRIGAYGYAQAHTPNLDKLAQEGARFDRAYAVVPLTMPYSPTAAALRSLPAPCLPSAPELMASHTTP